MKDYSVRTKMFKSIIRIVNEETGEVTERIEHYIKEVKRDKFVKWYYENTGALFGLSHSEVMLLLSVVEYMKYDNELFLSVENRKKIAKIMNRSLGRINDLITALVKKEMIHRMSRGHYVLNPDIAFKGDDEKRIEVFRRIIEVKIQDSKKK